MEIYKRNKLYELYKGSFVKWDDLKEILEDFEYAHQIYYELFKSCPFCRESNNTYVSTNDYSTRCERCLIDKRICDKEGNKGIISLFDNINSDYYNKNQTLTKFKRRILFLVNIITKSLKWNMNKIK